MKKNTLIIIFLILLTGMGYYLFTGEKELGSVSSGERGNYSLTQHISESAPTNQLDKQTTKNIQIASTWSKLGLSPVKIPEGGYYTISAFDYDTNSEELVVGVNSNQNKVIYIRDNSLHEVILDDNIIDMLFYNHTLYVLGEKKVFVIKNKMVHSEYSHGISNVFNVDKMIEFDSIVQVLMSDGSAYVLSDNSKPKPVNGLLNSKGKPISINRSSKSKFEVTQSNGQSPIYSGTINKDKELGSLSIVGGDMNVIYFITEEMSYKNGSFYVDRYLNQTDSANKTLMSSNNNFSNIKNNIKLMEDQVLILTLNKEGLILKTL